MESGGSFDFDLAGGSQSEDRGSGEGWGGDVTLVGGEAATFWGGAAAIESVESSRHGVDLDVRDVGKEPVRISLAAVCVRVRVCVCVLIPYIPPVIFFQY